MIFETLRIVKRLVNNGSKVFIFVPTISLTYRYYSLLKPFIKDITYYHSQIENRNDYFTDIKKGRYQVIITTTILERGITIDNLDVIVVDANHQVLNAQTLVQIAGRVGRTPIHPNGNVYFLASTYNQAISDAIKEIEHKNEEMFALQQRDK